MAYPVEKSNVLEGERLRARVREIDQSDIAYLADFLGNGLGYRSEFYAALFDRLGRRPCPSGFPRYGYVLESGSKIVGCILLIYSWIEQDDRPFIRCHVTSWYVEPQFRPLAAVFFTKQLKRKDVSYVNISARPATIPIIKSQGFQTYARGQFVVLTPIALATRSPAEDVVVVGPEEPLNAEVSDFEHKLVRDHARFGCIAFWCVQGGRAYPFVFYEFPFKRIIPGVQLAYCQSMETFIQFARPLSLYLLARRKLVVRVDANGPLKGLLGKYFDGMEPRYFRGIRPRLGDLAYTQTVMCPWVRSSRPRG
jgi:hypothetical protein